MRSIALALVLAAPCCALASAPATIPTPEYQNVVWNLHHERDPEVMVTFINHTVTDRELLIGGQKYEVRILSKLSVLIPIGDPVFVYSQRDSKVHGQELMRADAKDQDRTILLK
ncbi:MAG: hypothetical protein ACLGQX_09935 [Acidobacteriota bacterium]|jgi:hypothetical protein